MRLTLKTVEPQDLVLLVIRSTIHMDTDTPIVLQPAVLEAKSELAGWNIHRLCGISIVARWLHPVSFAGAVRLCGYCCCW
jgi:hypothetical protein